MDGNIKSFRSLRIDLNCQSIIALAAFKNSAPIIPLIFYVLRFKKEFIWLNLVKQILFFIKNRPNLNHTSEKIASIFLSLAQKPQIFHLRFRS